MRRITQSHAGRAAAVIVIGVVALGLASCAAVLGAIEDRLPPPEEVRDGILFRYYAPSARQLTLAGSFNNWGGTKGGGRYDPDIDPMHDQDGDGVWSITVPLAPGRYQYKYVIDGGVRWEKDPNNPDTGTEDGIENSLVVVPPTVRYDYEVVTGTVISGEQRTAVVRDPGAKSEPAAALVTVDIAVELEGATEVFVAGDWNGWEPTEHRLEAGDDGFYRVTLELRPGTYEYKLIIDGTWVEDPGNPNTVPDPYGGVNSVLTVE
ncbi:MAG: glycogen-binding domain-containing protein [Candidatus Eisenbacteria bacterium]